MTDPAFGRPRDDRRFLVAGFCGAVLLHVAAVFIPLPDREALEPPVPAYEGPTIYDIPIPPPDLPAPPPEARPAALDRQVWVPWPEPPEPVPVSEPDFDDFKDIEPVDVASDWEPGEDIPPPPPPSGIVEQGTQGLVLPVPLERPKPEFPQAAIVTRIPGRVVLAAVIDREGDVTEIDVVWVTEPDLGFAEKAIEAVRTWKYRPGELRGHPVAVRLTVEVTFSVN